MLPGLFFRETLSGSYWLLDAPVDELAMRFTLDAHARDLIEFAQKRTWEVLGTIDAERLASQQKLEGTLRFKPLHERRMAYRFRFEGDDGHRYELSGYRTWSGLAPVESLTRLPASLYDEAGEEIGRATLRFDLRSDWARLLKSFRLVFS